MAAEKAERGADFGTALEAYAQLDVREPSALEIRQKRADRAGFAVDLQRVAAEEEARENFKTAHKCYEVIASLYEGTNLPPVAAELKRLRRLWDYPHGGVIIWLWEDYVLHEVVRKAKRSGSRLPFRFQLVLLRRRLFWIVVIIGALCVAHEVYKTRGY